LEDVAYVINVRTKIPIYEIMQDNVQVIDNIRAKLSNSIIGQDMVINRLVDITKRIKLGYRDSKVYSMMFVGPTGVGKTKISKLFANLVVGEENLIRLDMSEYSDSMGVNKILGSAPGYVGYSDNKNILELVKNNPNSVILLDEIDKAHSSIINILYQILDEGRIKDSKGDVVRFDNAIIIMTSNIGFESNMVGFNKITRDNVVSSLKSSFNLAFINRIDDVIIFDSLSKESVTKIVKNNLKKIRAKYNNINLVFGKDVVKEIVELSNYQEFGARKIEKIIEMKIENAIIDEIIKGNKDVEIKSLGELVS
jgi:ATP-dependent Clp protease ATP-binding subunit ClpA